MRERKGAILLGAAEEIVWALTGQGSFYPMNEPEFMRWTI